MKMAVFTIEGVALIGAAIAKSVSGRYLGTAILLLLGLLALACAWVFRPIRAQLDE